MKKFIIQSLIAAVLLPLAASADDKKKDGQPNAKQGTYLGVALATIPAIAREQLDIPEGVGVAVGQVAKDSPADKAKLKANDIITKIDDQLIINADQFQTLIKVKKPGDEITMTLYRKGKEQKVKAKLAKGNIDIQLGQRNVPLRRQGGQRNPQFRGGFMPFPFIDPNNPQAMEQFRKAIEEWQEQWKNMGPGQLPRGGGGLAIPAFPFDPGQRQPLPKIPGGAKQIRVANASATIKDNTGTYTLTTNNGKKAFKAIDNNGEVLFEGPVNTDKERKEVPKEVRGKLEQLENANKNQKRFEFKFNLDGLNFDLDGDLNLDDLIPPFERKPAPKRDDI